MTCEEVRPLLGAFFDKEVTDIELSQKIQSHLETCGACAKELEAMSHVSASLQSSPARFAMPATLEGRVKAVTGVSSLRDTIRTPKLKPWRIYLAFAVPATCFVVMGAAVMFLIDHPTATIEDELVGDHIRSLQASHLFDVPSTDQHTVKPWFQGKLDFSPSVPELVSRGFPLLGGRLDYVANRPAAAIVYGRAKHVINVLVVLHAKANVPAGVIDRNGYHVIAWQKGGLDYWAVSDVNPADLEKFRSAFISSS